MNKTCLASIPAIFLAALLSVPAAADPAAGSPEGHDYGPAAGMSPAAMREMMMENNPGMMGMMHHGEGMLPPGMVPPPPSARLQMMGGALSGHMPMDPGRMRAMMDHEFFLDRVEELGLSAEQVAKLQAIRSACRKDNIRTGAEARIARMDLDDLLSQDDWTLAAAEKLVRQQQTLEGDMQVRHLKALAEARAVLTPEQLQKLQDESED